MGKQTPLFAEHTKANAKIVDFSGWEMPLHYGSQLEEHHVVRTQVGMFDVSHMGIVDLHGISATPFLRTLLANNIDKLNEGKALYSCMLNDAGGVIDDLIVYKIANNFFRLVINAGTREKDIAWIRQQATPYDLEIKERLDLAMLAVQGPQAEEKLATLMPAIKEELNALKPFHFLVHNKSDLGELFIARTGYTGENGYEIILPDNHISELWRRLFALGVAPCGLGARDTLRLEAGLNLYGADMDETVTPIESNLSWTVILDPSDRQFIGRDALETKIHAGIQEKLVGLVLEGPGIMRNHQKVYSDDGVNGEITSGGYSPTLKKSIALARVPVDMKDRCFVEIRNKKITAIVVKPPFVKKGKACV